MSIVRPITIAALASAIAAPAIADTEQTIYLNPIVGYQLFDDKRDLDESATYGVGVEFRFLPRWATELVYNRADASRKYFSGGNTFEEIRVDGLYYFADQNEAFNPYLAIGAGHADFGKGPISDKAGSYHDETRVNFGGGVRYNVTDLVSLRGDIRQFHGIDQSTFDTMASVGFSLAFGRTTAAAPTVVAEPEVVEVVEVIEAVEVVETIETIELRVQFPFDSSVIDHSFDDEIRQVADFMEEFPETTVEIAGHSDATGKTSYNELLSLRRAEAVAGRLTDALGVDSNRVSAVGYGEAEPVADNSTEAGRTKNRRVEARIQVTVQH